MASLLVTVRRLVMCGRLGAVVVPCEHRKRRMWLLFLLPIARYILLTV